MKKMYCVIKELVLDNGVIQNVVLVNSLSEIIEFETYDEAKNLAEIFEKNSDSKLKYTVKEI
jgi:hypothetical protein